MANATDKSKNNWWLMTLAMLLLFGSQLVRSFSPGLEGPLIIVAILLMAVYGYNVWRYGTAKNSPEK